MNPVAILENLIAAAIGAIVYWLWQKDSIRRKRKKLEDHLRMEKQKLTDKGQRTISHLIKHLGMTETEILQASISPKIIRRLRTETPGGLATEVLFEYNSKSN
jgi:hypothetical protein